MIKKKTVEKYNFENKNLTLFIYKYLFIYYIFIVFYK